MNILLLNTYARSGGASVAARRLCAALNGAGETARLLVQNAEGEQAEDLLTTRDGLAAFRPRLDSLPVLLNRNRRTPHWGNAWLHNGAACRAVADFAPDVTHLHWINHGMLSIADLEWLDGPLVWTLHDSWPMTGGCHSPQDCTAFEKECGHCPELRSRRDRDLSRWIWNRKQTAWEQVDFTVVTPSQWLADRARRASLFQHRRIEVIPNAVDTAVFRPVDRRLARQELNLPSKSKRVLFAAHGALNDWNKGADLWKAAMAKLGSRCPGAEAVVAGTEEPVALDGMPCRSLGVLSPDRLALALSAADVVVVPSRMENLPNIVAESLACGTPVAAFSVGGIPEMIQEGETGFLAVPHDPESLAAAVADGLARSEDMREACVAAARGRYAPETVARRHLDLYHSLLESK